MSPRRARGRRRRGAAPSSATASRHAGSTSMSGSGCVGRPRDAEPAGRRADLVEERPFGRRRATTQSPARVPLHHVEERGRVGDRARDRSVRRVPALGPGRPRHPTSRRLDAEDAAPRRRDADRAAAVGAVGDGAQARPRPRHPHRPTILRACASDPTGCGRSGTRASRSSSASRTPVCSSCRRSRTRRGGCARRPRRRSRERGRARSRCRASSGCPRCR